MSAALQALKFTDPLACVKWGLAASEAPPSGSSEEQLEHQLERIRQWAKRWQVNPVVIPLLFDMGLSAYSAAVGYAPIALAQPWHGSGLLPNHFESVNQVKV